MGTYDSNFMLHGINEYDPLISTFSGDYPNAPTNKSGHYTYMNAFGEHETTFLNCANDITGVQSGEGGFQFHSVNSSQADIQLMKLTREGLTIDKSIPQGQPILLPLPNVQNSIDIAVYLSSSVDGPPWNMGPVNTVYPVQVNSNCTNMSVGITYYAKYFNGTTLQMNSNQDGGVPTIINSADLFSRPQPILSLITGYNPIPQIVNINEELTITTNTDESILSATDLTFNTVSLQETLTNLTIKQITSANQYISAVITADARPPTAPTSTITQTYAFTPAWYFKNTFNSNNKINWYLGPSIGMTVADVLGLYMNMFNGLTTSNDDTPFIVIYTANDSVPPVNFYKSKRTYIFDQAIQPTTNTRYFNFANVSTSCPIPNYYGSNLINMDLSTVAGSQVGAFAPTELILAFAINTNSASAKDSVEFAINKFGIMTPIGTQEALFIPST